MNYTQYQDAVSEIKTNYEAVTQELVDAKAARMIANLELKRIEDTVYLAVRNRMNEAGVKFTERVLEAEVGTNDEVIAARAEYQIACNAYEVAKRKVINTEMDDKQLRGYDERYMTGLGRFANRFSWTRLKG